MAIRFDGQVVVVTGAGSGLGKAYAVFYGSRGASVVVNDVGSTLTGGKSKLNPADEVVRQITEEGGRAVADTHSVEEGPKIIDTAIGAFGAVHILINNAGILCGESLSNMTDAQWDAVQSVHVRGAYKTTQAAWKHFRKQKYGRVILTSSAAGLYGSSNQSNYSAAKSAMVGFGETLGKEGVKYNILTNIIAPIAATRMTTAVMPGDLLRYLQPEWVVPLVAILTHKTNSENGSVFELGGGHMSKLRWERAEGALLKCDETLTPGAVLEKWAMVNDFSSSETPRTTADLVSKLKASQQLPPNEPGPGIRFDGKVALVTGGGAGLGRAYCLQLARLGASVVVNDAANPDAVVQEIRNFGGKAVPVKASAEDGDLLVETAIDSFGRIDILINNAGILRDKSFQNMTDEMWDSVNNVHLRATFKCARAAFPYMIKQGYGRIVNTTSTSGTYGNYGQSNYAAAKTGIVGFSRALALEAKEYNIRINCISPSAGTELTKTALPEEVLRTRKPDYVAPIVLLLSSDRLPTGTDGHIFESGCGWQARIRFQRSKGHDFPLDHIATPEEVQEAWHDIVDFASQTRNPETPSDTLMRITTNIARSSKAKPTTGTSQYIGAIERAKQSRAAGSSFSYTDKDVILYNISLGAEASDLPWVYEHDPSFQALPSYGVIPGTTAPRGFNLEEIVPNYSYKNILHGEHFLELRKSPVPTTANLVSYSNLVDVLDKGKASIVIVGTLTKDVTTGEEVFYNESSLFIRGSGNFGGSATRSSSSGDASAPLPEPVGAPTKTVEEKTTTDQAALYRLNGDRNPLHIDPAVAKAVGFRTPILHGLCSFGIITKQVVMNFGQIKNVRIKFVGTVNPGQTLVTDMWRHADIVRFQTKVKETEKLCMLGAARLQGGRDSRL